MPNAPFAVRYCKIERMYNTVYESALLHSRRFFFLFSRSDFAGNWWILRCAKNDARSKIIAKIISLWVFVVYNNDMGIMLEYNVYSAPMQRVQNKNTQYLFEFWTDLNALYSEYVKGDTGIFCSRYL